MMNCHNIVNMSHKWIVAISVIISLSIFVSCFFWFDVWRYGLLCYSLTAILAAIIRIKFETFFELDSPFRQLMSGILLFSILLGIVSLAILAYSVTGSGDSFRMKPD